MPLVALTIVIAIIYTLQTRKININFKTLLWLSANTAYGAVWIIIGAVRSNPGVMDYFRLNLLWIILYTVFINSISNIKIITSLTKVITFGGFAIAAYNILYVFSMLNMWPGHLFYELDTNSLIGLHTGYMVLTAHNIGSLAFILPFVFTQLLLHDKTKESTMNRIILITVFLLTLITSLLSGRRILVVNLLLTPFIIYFIVAFAKNEIYSKVKRKLILYTSVTCILIFAAGVYAQIYTSFSYEVLTDRFKESVEENDIRPAQMRALLKGFSDSPLLGSGFGAGVNEVVADSESPWNYELSYVLQLYNTGLIGIIIYLITILWIYVMGVKILRDPHVKGSVVISLLVGMTTFLIANATNPYFHSYDFMWVVFLPVAYINLFFNGKLSHIKTISIDRALGAQNDL